MLYAKRNSTKDNVETYILLINELLKNIEGATSIRIVIHALYDDTKGIINKTHSYYSIQNRESIPLIAFLAEKHPDHFQEVDTDSIDTVELSVLKEYLEEAASAV